MVTPACLPHSGSHVPLTLYYHKPENKIIITSWDMTGTTGQLQVQVTGTAGTWGCQFEWGDDLIVAGCDGLNQVITDKLI